MAATLVPAFDAVLRSFPYKQPFPGNLTQFVGAYSWTTEPGLRLSLDPNSHRRLLSDPTSDGTQVL